MVIQIVDDSSNMREIIKSILAGLDVEFVESADGAGAVLQHALTNPDLVFMDIRLGGMDGIAATRAIRATQPGARVVIVTQYDDADLREAAREAGAESYVLKDDLSVLRDIVHKPKEE